MKKDKGKGAEIEKKLKDLEAKLKKRNKANKKPAPLGTKIK